MSDSPKLNLPFYLKPCFYQHERWLRTGANQFRPLSYPEYLRSPEWEVKRRQVFERCGGICENCHELPATEIHHTSYTTTGREFFSDLLALCRYCHERIHGIVAKWTGKRKAANDNQISFFSLWDGEKKERSG